MKKSLILLISITIIILLTGAGFFFMNSEKEIMVENENINVISQENQQQGITEADRIREEARLNESSRMCEAIKQMNPELCNDFNVIGGENQSRIENECKNAVYLKKMIFENINQCANMNFMEDVLTKEDCEESFKKINNPSLANNEFESIFYTALNKKDAKLCDDFNTINRTQDASYCRNLLDEKQQC